MNIQGWIISLTGETKQFSDNLWLFTVAAEADDLIKKVSQVVRELKGELVRTEMIKTSLQFQKKKRTKVESHYNQSYSYFEQFYDFNMAWGLSNMLISSSQKYDYKLF